MSEPVGLLAAGFPLLLAGALLGVGMMGGALSPPYRRAAEICVRAGWSVLLPAYAAWTAYRFWRDGDLVGLGALAASTLIFGLIVLDRSRKTKIEGQGASQ